MLSVSDLREPIYFAVGGEGPSEVLDLGVQVLQRGCGCGGGKGGGSQHSGWAWSTLCFQCLKVDEQVPPRAAGAFQGWLGNLLSRVLRNGHRTWVWGVVWGVRLFLGLVTSFLKCLVRPDPSWEGRAGNRKLLEPGGSQIGAGSRYGVAHSFSP